MNEQAEQEQTPEQFLAEVAKSLKAKESTDKELATIIETHILVGAPLEKAVTNAKDAIIALAGTRAQPKAEGADV